MDISKVTVNLLKKRLKKQKRLTFFMFIFGLILGGIVAFSLYYWYPFLENKFGLKPIKQVSIQKKQTATQEESTTSSVKKESEDNTRTQETSFTPRIAFQNPVDISPANENLNQQLEQSISQNDLNGTVLAIKNNQIVLLKNYGNATELSTDPIKSTYMIASVQKAITALLIMKLIEDQQLTLDTPLATFYPDIPNSDNITIDEMLSMNSGLSSKKLPNNTKSKEDAIQYVLKNVTYEEPTKWHYSTVNFFLLASIIEKLSNKTYEDYFDEVIKKPLNLKHTGFYNEIDNDKDSQLIPSHYRNKDGTLKSGATKIRESSYINELGTGNMYASVGDLATIIQARTDGDIISHDVLIETLELQPANYPYIYKAGFYKKDDYSYSHGLFRGYEPTIYFDDSASTMVIFLSNAYTTEDSANSQNRPYTEELFQLLSEAP